MALFHIHNQSGLDKFVLFITRIALEIELGDQGFVAGLANEIMDVAGPPKVAPDLVPPGMDRLVFVVPLLVREDPSPVLELVRLGRMRGIVVVVAALVAGLPDVQRRVGTSLPARSQGNKRARAAMNPSARHDNRQRERARTYRGHQHQTIGGTVCNPCDP